MADVIALIIVLVIIFLSLILYLLPSIIAFHYNEKSKWWILLLTLVFGWSCVGWLLAFIWAILEKDGDDLPKKIMS